jgi:ankyrin repeat protein
MADINIADNSRETCLMIAAHNDCPKTVHRLIDLGADIDARDAAGETALFKAVKNTGNGNTPSTGISEDEHRHVIKQLVEHGADVNSLNNAGVSPLGLARQQNRLKIAKLLESLGGKDIRPVAKAE